VSLSPTNGLSVGIEPSGSRRNMPPTNELPVAAVFSSDALGAAEAAAVQLADDAVELAVGAEADDAAVVVRAVRLRRSIGKEMIGPKTVHELRAVQS
jgi:hypothetical protein